MILNELSAQAFDGTRNGIDNRFAKKYNERVRQGEAKTSVTTEGLLLGRVSINSITHLDENVKTLNNFYKWFGNSKVVDNQGNPLVVYHGSPEKFEIFEPERMNYGSISRGFCFFTNKKSAYPNCAKDYAGKNGYVYECYLKIEKPLHIKYGNTPDEYYHTPVHYWDTCQSDIRRDFRKGNFDGIIIENLNKNEDDSVIYLVPNANQIKSIDAVSFSDSDNIYEQLAYHGTRAKFDKFDLSKFQRGDYGYGIYFTKSKGYASDYGEVNEYIIPDDEFLLSWEDTWQYQSEYVYNCLDRLFDDLYDNNREAWEKIIDIVDRGYGNDGEGLYMNLSEILNLSSQKLCELLYKYGIKGIDSFKGNCKVIFNPDDISLNIAKVNEELERYL